MRGPLIVLLSAALAAAVEDVPDACAGFRCNSGLQCAMVAPMSCRVSPCPKMPECVPQNSTCQANSCAADETCILRQVHCIAAPCFPVRECKKYPKCAAGEEYNECSLSGPCEPTCKDAFPICSNVDCGKGACECKPGYYRNNGTCITKAQCPDPTCDKPNEVWNKCPSTCTKTCRILRGKDQQQMCTMKCDTPQCTCAPGFVRDDDWNCVKEAACPTEFKCDSPHEEFQNCSTKCEPTCDNRSHTCIESCGPAKCQCKPNYVRDNGHCIFALQCPMAGNSTMRPVKRNHDKKSKEGSNSASEENYGSSCMGVYCANNTACSLKNGSAICAKCGQNEQIDPCPNRCSEKSCGDNGAPCFAPKMCQWQACRCADGFVRNMQTGLCIVKSQCPAGSNDTMSIMPMPQTRPAIGSTIVRPVFSGTNGTMHIMPIAERELSDPLPGMNGTKLTMPMIQPYIPVTNGTNPLIRPFFPSNETMHIMPLIQTKPENASIAVRPILLDDRMLVDPIPGNNATKQTMPMIRPSFPANNGSGSGAVHIMPLPADGSMLIDPIPGKNGTKQTNPLIRPLFASNETMYILPIGLDDRMLADPVPGKNVTKQTMPMIRPFFPATNGSDSAAVHIMPFPANVANPLIRPLFPSNETMHIMPFPADGSMLIDPIPGKNGTKQTSPLIRPLFPSNGTMHTMPYPAFNGSDLGAVHIMPVFSNLTKPMILPLLPVDNGTMHIMPMIENGTMHIMPFFGTNGSNNGAVHTMPYFPPTNGAKPMVRPLFPSNETMHIMPFPAANGTKPMILPFFPATNGSMNTMPMIDPVRPIPGFNGTDNGAVHIMPVFPGKNGTGGVQILPFIPANGSAVDVCATHECSAGLTCEAVQVRCFVTPCNPIATCVSISPAGGIAREDPLVCGKNEEMSECAPPCQETCRGYADCAGVMAAVCRAGCVCKDKFKRDSNGVCVPNSKCWKTAGCQENESWHKCHTCEATCDDAKEICTDDCASGCACDDGFVRSPSGDCIQQAKCPKPAGNATRT